MKENIKPATGRLGVLVVGVGGAVSTTMITGTLAARKGLAKPIGSITQMAIGYCCACVWDIFSSTEC